MRKPALIIIIVFVLLYLKIPILAANTHIYLVEPIESKTLYFSDSNISISFEFPKEWGRHKRIAFTVRNKTDKALTVIWEGTSIVLPSNQTSNVIHEGIRYMRAQEPISPTTIPPRAKLSDSVIPTANIYYDNIGGDWEVDELNFKVGSSVGLYLSFIMEGERKGYNFKFIKRSISQKTTAEFKIQTIGFTLPTFGSIKYNSSKQIIALEGINFFLGYSYRRYLSPLHTGLNFFWGGGTFVLIVPYWEFGSTYAIPLGYQSYLNFDLYFIYVVPILGFSIIF